MSAVCVMALLVAAAGVGLQARLLIEEIAIAHT
jgi:hypothetical protein